MNQKSTNLKMKKISGLLGIKESYVVSKEFADNGNFIIASDIQLAFILAGITNMSFYVSNSSLYVYKNGMIWINDSAGFNKKTQRFQKNV